MLRELHIIRSQCAVELVELPTDLRTWLETQAQTLTMRWLLAHDDSGVIWGELRAEGLALSCDAYPRPGLRLRATSLQQARLFGASGELLLWRGPDERWRTTLRRDGAGDECAYFDEGYLLWGYAEEQAPRDGFRELREGAQGIVHAPPLARKPTEQQRACLRMRHYLQTDLCGVVHTVAGRMLDLN